MNEVKDDDRFVNEVADLVVGDIEGDRIAQRLGDPERSFRFTSAIKFKVMELMLDVDLPMLLTASF